MSDPDAVKRLLEGNIDPSEIEDNPRLYAMAERIYGREALEELGVYAPEIETPVLPTIPAPIPEVVSLPDFVPDIPQSKSYEINIKKGKRRVIALIVGVFGLLGVGLNIAIGMGKFLCSIGIADMKEICSEGNTKVVLTKAYSWDSLHQIDTWVMPMDADLADGVLIMIFSLLTMIGLFVRKKSVHSGEMLPLEG